MYLKSTKTDLAFRGLIIGQWVGVHYILFRYVSQDFRHPRKFGTPAIGYKCTWHPLGNVKLQATKP